MKQERLKNELKFIKHIREDTINVIDFREYVVQCYVNKVLNADEVKIQLTKQT